MQIRLNPSSCTILAHVVFGIWHVVSVGEPVSYHPQWQSVPIPPSVNDENPNFVAVASPTLNVDVTGRRAVVLAHTSDDDGIYRNE